MDESEHGKLSAQGRYLCDKVYCLFSMNVLILWNIEVP